MGFGDVTLMAVIGAAVGPGRALLVVLRGRAHRRRGIRRRGLSALARCAAHASGLSRLGSRARATPQSELPHVPFGVFLAPAALATLLWGYDLIGWYSSRLTN